MRPDSPGTSSSPLTAPKRRASLQPIAFAIVVVQSVSLAGPDSGRLCFMMTYPGLWLQIVANSLVMQNGQIGNIPTGVQFSLSGSSGSTAISYDAGVSLPAPLNLRSLR